MANPTLRHATTVIGEIPSVGGPFVIVKKKHLDEFQQALRAIVRGEDALTKGKTRTFSEFLRHKFPQYAKNK